MVKDDEALIEKGYVCIECATWCLVLSGIVAISDFDLGSVK